MRDVQPWGRTFYAPTSETLENTGFFSIFFVCNLICDLKLQPNSFSQIVFWFRIHRGLILMMETLFELFPSTLQVYCIPNACKCRGWLTPAHDQPNTELFWHRHRKAIGLWCTYVAKYAGWLWNRSYILPSDCFEPVRPIWLQTSIVPFYHCGTDSRICCL